MPVSFVSMGDLSFSMGGLSLSMGGLSLSMGGLSLSMGGLSLSMGGLSLSMGGLSFSMGGLSFSMGGLSFSMGGLSFSMGGLSFSMGGLAFSMGDLSRGSGSLLREPRRCRSTVGEACKTSASASSSARGRPAAAEAGGYIVRIRPAAENSGAADPNRRDFASARRRPGTTWASSSARPAGLRRPPTPSAPPWL